MSLRSLGLYFQFDFAALMSFMDASYVEAVSERVTEVEQIRVISFQKIGLKFQNKVIYFSDLYQSSLIRTTLHSAQLLMFLYCN